MPPSQPVKVHSSSMLILGCGYLGDFLARSCLNKGIHVGALSRNPETCSHLQKLGVPEIACDQLETTAWHKQFVPDDWDVIVNCVGSGDGTEHGYRRSYLHGMSSLLSWVHNHRSRQGRLIYTSSTSVYGQHHGAWVDEETPSDPVSIQGKIILESERLLLAQCPSQVDPVILRLGGLWGPGRSRFLARPPPAGTPSQDYNLNLIHIHDVVEAILLVALRPDKPRFHTYNITDNLPSLRSTIDSKAPQLSGAASPPPSPATLRSTNPSRPDRRIRSDRFQQDFSWKPHHLGFWVDP